MILHRIVCVTLILSIMVSGAWAQQYLAFSNGTGFYVTKDGYIVTNAHVVRGCNNTVEVSNPTAPNTVVYANIIARDENVDLALLKSQNYAPDIAPIRADSDTLSNGEPLIVMGYGGKLGLDRQYSFVKSTLLITDDIVPNSKIITFADSAQKGNSGGPLLDNSGRVIGVIRGKTFFENKNKANNANQTTPGPDIAISLSSLISFLENNHVRARYAREGMLSFSDGRLESSARNFIVQLRCQTN